MTPFSRASGSAPRTITASPRSVPSTLKVAIAQKCQAVAARDHCTPSTTRICVVEAERRSSLSGA
jgi:hypothetical protein